MTNSSSATPPMDPSAPERSTGLTLVLAIPAVGCAAVIVGLALGIGITGIMWKHRPLWPASQRPNAVYESRQTLEELYTLEQHYYHGDPSSPHSGHGAFAVTQRTPLVTAANGPNMRLCQRIGFDPPTGYPRFDFYLEPNGGAVAVANLRDAELKRIGVTLSIDGEGTLFTTTSPRAPSVNAVTEQAYDFARAKDVLVRTHARCVEYYDAGHGPPVLTTTCIFINGAESNPVWCDPHDSTHDWVIEGGAEHFDYYLAPDGSVTTYANSSRPDLEARRVCLRVGADGRFTDCTPTPHP